MRRHGGPILTAIAIKSRCIPRQSDTGGITDRLLSDYPNMYGDLSAGSGLNSMLRDEDHAREFLKRHQEKLMFGSDCTDTAGAGDKCLGAQILAAVRRLAPEPNVQRKIFHQNAMRIIKVRF